MTLIFWKSGKNLGDFLKELKGIDSTRGCLSITQRFIDASVSLNAEPFEELCKAMKTYCIPLLKLDNDVTAYFDRSSTRALSTEQRRARIEHICAALGSNVSLCKFSMPLMRFEFKLAGILLRSLRQVDKLELREDGFPTNSDLARLRDLLERHPLISEVELAIRTRNYRTVLPVLSTFPLLSKIKFHHIYNDMPRVAVAPEDGQAVGELIAGKRTLRDVSFNYLIFGDGASCHFVCDGLRNSRISSMEMNFCEINDQMLATALTNLPLRTINVDNMGVLYLWSTTLSESQARYDVEMVRVTRVPMDERFVNIILQLTHCPNLKKLVLETRQYSDGIDIALAECVDRCPKLATIYIGFPNTLPGFPNMFSCPLPALFKSIMSNYTIQVNFGASHQPQNGTVADSIELLQMVSSLNQAGRIYLAEDPNNQRKGFAVLGEVKDNLNSLFFHLRENPLLCRRGSALEAITGQKRQAAAAAVDERPATRARST
ncbi:hypothetical protein MPSEU_000597500 [Mayamaea pseudoterrestris]|nr:hypothetical protein MPSEU_000597500 [Mayamaea pseudoterrestris]